MCCGSTRCSPTGSGGRWWARAVISPGCAPRNGTSDAVFSTLIGGSGCYAVTPADPRFVWGGYYEDGSLIWRSRWITGDGVIECREALAYPGDARTAVLLRRIEAVDAPARVRVLLDVRAGFGRHTMTHLKNGAAAWTGRSGPLHLRWSGGGQATVRSDGSLELDLTLKPGDRHDLVLEISDQALAAEPVARRAGLGSHRGRVGGGASRPDVQPGAPRVPAQLRGAGRA